MTLIRRPMTKREKAQAKRQTKRQADHILHILSYWTEFPIDPHTVITNASSDLVNPYEIAAQVQFVKKWLDRLARASAVGSRGPTGIDLTDTPSTGTAEIIEFPRCRQR